MAAATQAAEFELLLDVCRKGRVEEVQRLLQSLPDDILSVKDGDGCTALHHACMGSAPGSVAVVKLLLDRVPDDAFSVADKRYRDPFAYACEAHNAEVVQIMAERMSFKDLASSRGTSMCAQQEYLDILDLIPVEALLAKPEYGQSCFFDEACTGGAAFIAMLNRLSDAQLASMPLNDVGGSPLHHTLIVSTMQTFLERCPRSMFLQEDSEGRTPLAMQSTNVFAKETVDWLVEELTEEEICRCGREGNALHFSRWGNALKIMPKMSAEALTARDRAGRTPLLAMATNEIVEAVVALISRLSDDDVTATTNEGLNALFLAIDRRQAALAKELIARFPVDKLAVQFSQGDTALHALVKARVEELEVGCQQVWDDAPPSDAATVFADEFPRLDSPTFDGVAPEELIAMLAAKMQREDLFIKNDAGDTAQDLATPCPALLALFPTATKSAATE